MGTTLTTFPPHSVVGPQCFSDFYSIRGGAYKSVGRIKHSLPFLTPAYTIARWVVILSFPDFFLRLSGRLRQRDDGVTASAFWNTTSHSNFAGKSILFPSGPSPPLLPSWISRYGRQRRATPDSDQLLRRAYGRSICLGKVCLRWKPGI